MKKYIAPLALILFISFTVQAQRTDLKGPAAKNYKPWEDKSVDQKSYVTYNSERIKGPEAKNSKIWKKDRSEADASYVVVNNREPLKGPEAKNYKPWENKRSEDIQVAEND